MQSVCGSGVHVTHRQGFGADLVMLARLRTAQLLQAEKLNDGEFCADLIGTIHDSIVVDCPSAYTERVGRILKQAVEEVPQYCQRVWQYNFTLPLTSEISSGPTKYNQKTLDL